MSIVIPESVIEEKANLFSVLGDSTRLKLVTSMVDGQRRSITDLSADFEVSRQAVTKHLKILEAAQIIGSEKSGRESLYTLKLESLIEIREMIESIEGQWEQTLNRLKLLVED